MQFANVPKRECELSRARKAQRPEIKSRSRRRITLERIRKENDFLRPS